MACNSKMAGRRGKLSDIWSQGELFYADGVPWTLIVLKVIWGHSVHSFQNGLYLEKGCP